MFGFLDFQIKSLFNGMMPSSFFGAEGQYLDAIGIDPDLPADDVGDDVRAAGVIRPVAYSSFDDTNLTSYPIAIIKTPKDTNTYVVCADGSMAIYNSSNVYQSTVNVSGAKANGAWYQNNYIYITTGTDVSRYGPLSSSPSLADNFWTSTLSKTALVNNSYPQVGILSIPLSAHWGFLHVDGAGYFLDYKDGKGMVHMINTKKVTAEGDTDDTTRPSAYNVLDLPSNYLPIHIGPYGEDIVVAAAFTNDSGVMQGPAALFFFNPADTVPSFYRKTPLPDPMCTATSYMNGQLRGLSGVIGDVGYRLWQYMGGDTISTLAVMEDAYIPLQGAVGFLANRMQWGASRIQPIGFSSGVFAYGTKSSRFPEGLHHVIATYFDSLDGPELLTNPNFTGNASGWTLGTGWAYSSNHIVFTPFGSELVTNGTFTGSASGWDVGSGWTYASNQVSTDGSFSGIQQTLNLGATGTFRCTFTIGTTNSSLLRVFLLSNITPEVDLSATAGAHTIDFSGSTTGSDVLKFIPDFFTPFIGVLDTVSLKFCNQGTVAQTIASAVAGQSYKFKVTVNTSGANISVSLGGGTAVVLTPGSYNESTTLVCGSSGTDLVFTPDIGASGTLDTVSLKAIGGLPAGTNAAMVTAIARTEQDFSYNSLMIGGKGGATGACALFGLDDLIVFNLFRSPVFHIGKPFTFVHMLLSLAGINALTAVEAGIVITPVLCMNHGTIRTTGTSITAALLTEILARTPSEEAHGFFKFTPEMFPFVNGTNTGAQGYNDVYMEFQFTNTAGTAVGVASISLPVTIRVSTED